MIKETGNYAFPVSTIDNHTNDGMTLRDYFAAAALQGVLSKYGLDGTMQMHAQVAYQYADAMLEERK